MPLQLAAVAALIALIFGLPRLRGQPTPIPDPTPRPLIEVAAPLPEATAADRPAQRQRDRPSHQQASARARPKRKPKAVRRHSAERQLPAAQRELAVAPSDEAHTAPSAAAAPAREFGWP